MNLIDLAALCVASACAGMFSDLGRMAVAWLFGTQGK